MRKKTLKRVLELSALAGVFMLSSCEMGGAKNPEASTVVQPSESKKDPQPSESKKDPEPTTPVEEQYQIYLLAVNSGYNGTYQQWLDSIKGDAVTLQVANGYIQWKYATESAWTNLIAVADFSGLSSYDIYKKYHPDYTGTEEEWINTFCKDHSQDTYTITFNSDGGSAVASQSKNVSERPSEPTAPTKAGYIFLGWYVADAKWDFKTNYYPYDMELKAKWGAVTSITLDCDGGSLNNVEEATISAYQDMVLPEPVRSGYEFRGWRDDNGALLEHAPSSNASLTAVWQPLTYHMDLRIAGTNTILTTVEVAYGEELPEAPKGYSYLVTKDAYTDVTDSVVDIVKKYDSYSYVAAPGDPYYSSDLGQVDMAVNNDGTYGVACVKDFFNPVDGKTYKAGEILPTWRRIGEATRTTIQDAGYTASVTNYFSTLDYNGYKSRVTQSQIDIAATHKYAELRDYSSELLDLTPYITEDIMPNLYRFYQENPQALQEMTTSDGKIYGVPYYDGMNSPERMFIMDTEIVAKVLNKKTLDVSNAIGENKLTSVKYTPFMDDEYNLPSTDLKVSVMNRANFAETIQLKQVKNIILQQNELLAEGCTGQELADQLTTYLKAVYGDYIGVGKLYQNYSDIYTSGSACYTCDELIALMRVVKANPLTITGDATKEVEVLFPRGEQDNRIENILDFAQIWGVNGLVSERDNLYFGADGKLYDGQTSQSSYDALFMLNGLYEEGLILNDFWVDSPDSSQTGYTDRFFKKNRDDYGYGFMMYDYSGTQSMGNDYIDGLGMKAENRKVEYSTKGIMPVLPPLTYWSTEDTYSHDQALSDKTGKTILRHYDENRGLKNQAWVIPASSDNVYGALRVIDYIFSDKGNMIFNLGPEEYWETDAKGNSITYDISDDVNGCPILSAQAVKAMESAGLDFWGYLRRCLGASLNCGVRPNGMNLQGMNAYARVGEVNLLNAIACGVVDQSTMKEDKTWNASVPLNGYPTYTLSKETEVINEFWYTEKLGKEEGWVAVISGKYKDDTTVLGTYLLNGVKNSYTLQDVYDGFELRDELYLKKYATALDVLPDYLKTI